jgi:hypothetical protein
MFTQCGESIGDEDTTKRQCLPERTLRGPEGSRGFSLSVVSENRLMKVARLSASRTGRLYPQEIFLLISVRG